MNEASQLYKYDAAERQQKALRYQVRGNRHQENRGNQVTRRR